MSPYYPPQGGGGGSGTPGGSDSQIQVNSQNVFAGFPNLRWIDSSASLDLNTAGRIRHGGVAEVDGVAPTGVTGLIWLDTSASSFTSSSAGLAGTGASFILQSGNSLLPNSQVLKSGSSTTVRTDGTGNIYVDASTGGGSSGSPQYKGWDYYLQIGSDSFNLGGYRALKIGSFLGGAATTTATPGGKDTIFFTPLLITKSCLIDSYGFAVGSVSGGAVAAMGIYTNSSDTILYPYQSIVTSGVMVGLSAGINSSLTVQTLSQNTLYWMCINLGTNIVSTWRVVPTASAFPIYTLASMANFGYGGNTTFTFSGVGLPSTISTGGSVISGNPVALFVRVSA